MESGLADKDKIEFEGSDDSMCDDAPGNGDVCNVPTDITESKDSGVIKEILKAGSGWEKPATGDKVFVHYVGSLEDGTVFDSSRERGSTFSFILGQGQVIKGWDIAVATMKPGELSKVTIKSGYGYGEAGSPPKIPPNATLIFEIELFDWKMMDCTKKEDAGVRKRIITQGTGYSTPNDGATIEAHIVGKFGDRVFEERDVSYAHGEPSEANICEGLDLAFGKMKLGEKALIFIRSEYAWGSNPPAEFNLPSNYEEVIYEVNLKRFEKVKEAWELTEEEKFAQAQLAKDKGSAYFKQNKLQLALKQYKRIPTLIGPFKSDGLSSSDEEDEQDIGQNDPDSVIPPKEKYAVLMAGHLNLAMVYLKLEQYPEVIKNINSAMKIDPNNCKGLYRRGLAYSGLKEYEKAIVDFEKLLQLEPDNLAAKNKLTIARHGLKVEKEKEKALFKNMISRYLASSGRDNTPSYDGKIDEVKFNEPPNEDSQSSVQEMN